MSEDNAVVQSEIAEVIADEFGLNADYVGELWRQYLREPSSLNEEWRAYFSELTASTHEAEAQPAASTPAAPAPGATKAPAPKSEQQVAKQPDKIVIRGAALRVAENMSDSLEVPTATSQRQIAIKLLDENRRLLNHHLEAAGKKVSYTMFIARAVLKALDQFSQLNDSYEEADGAAYRVRNEEVNLGIAVDTTRKDGSRSLLVPNIKRANKLSFLQLMDAYDDVVNRAREGKLEVADYHDTTITITNPGTLGTTASNPRLMSGQGLIVATGSIEYPPEYRAMTAEALSLLGISKVMTLTSTYDHRIIQGAESGAFLGLIDELLSGGGGFYDRIFAEVGVPHRPYRWAIDQNPAILGEARHSEEIRKQARVLELINAYRVRGHLIADIDPLERVPLQYHPELDIESYGLAIWDLDREFISGGIGGAEGSTLRKILDQLRRFYCGKVGVEYRNIQSPDEKEWIRSKVEQDQPAIPVGVRNQILWKLISAEQFERFLAAKYPGQKRFSIEGSEVLVALLDQLIESSPRLEISDITIGMSHRGRLNVIANVIGRFCERIFTSFEGSIHPDFPHDFGDVKYHQGASGVRETGGGDQVTVAVVPNPSHLEFVDPVVEGIVRAKQDAAESRAAYMAVLVHGDAAFSGEGIVAETLNLSQLRGYSTVGTIHIIVNNQLGFTTNPEEGRSSTYSTDIAKMIQVPIFHVNADDPDAAYNALQIALEYRTKFKKDVVIDLVGFRRHGHNEGDEPTYTQPVMYRKVRAHEGVRTKYGRRLIREGIIDGQSVQPLIDERNRRYENALLGAKEILARQGSDAKLSTLVKDEPDVPLIETGIGLETLQRIARTVNAVPRDFHLHPKIVGLLARRAKMVEGDVPVDWAMAEALAVGSLLLEGTNVRVSGQDTVRGTFSQRHAAFSDTQTGEEWIPLSALSSDSATFQIYDSPLSEAGTLGFEYGYSVASPQALVMWEAQYGDFINAAQVIVDQFIAAGEEKWDQKSRLVLLLPHGYEGQGPEHSSARLERFLETCAGGNLQVVSCSTAAQYFHVLRRQLKHPAIKPLVVMTPKSLLRSAGAASSIDEFTRGGFKPVIGDDRVGESQEVERVILCTGRVYYEIAAERDKQDQRNTAILRVEQFYPFPSNLLQEHLSRYPKATEVRWVQEEPANMGAWRFMEDRLRPLLAPNLTLSYVGRPASASTATGSHTIHQMEQRTLIEEAFKEAGRNSETAAHLSDRELRIRGKAHDAN